MMDCVLPSRNARNGFLFTSTGRFDSLSHKCENDVLTSAEMKRWLEKQGCTFGTQKGSHLKVYLGDRQTILPMHPKKELKTGTVEGIKNRLGLKHTDSGGSQD